ncbi:cytochrome P450 4V2 [Ixodes scapularis]|uniref:cytochrome P450 4V2 n=1 Tax=Ixodes scapularis TaxID=6945 RepID=UPI001A9D41DD|nr:cytochrome P450 4V2 [Ixodes scapularis]
MPSTFFSWTELWDAAVSIGMFALVTVFTCVCFKMLVRWIRIYLCLRNVPQPKERFPFSLILDMWSMMSAMDPALDVPAKLFNYFHYMFQQVVDQELTVAFYGPQPFLIALTPNAAERVLSNSENLNKSFLYDMMKSWIGNGLLTSYKDIWKKRRKVLTPAFHFRVLEDYVPVMNRRASELVKKMNSLSSGSFDLLPVMRIAAFGILFETAMGIQLDENEVLRTGFLQVNDEISSSIIARMLNIYHWLDITYGFSPEGRRYYKKVELIKEYTQKILRTRKATYKIGVEEKDRNKSFMDILLRMHMDEGIFTEDEIREEVNTFMIGGFDTTATAAAFAVHLLGNHPEAQAKVHDEIDSVFGNDRERPVTTDDIRNLKYLDCVLKETLRLYPPIPAIARKIDEDVVIGKHTIPKGTVSIVMLYFLHRHPRFFEKPDAFFPERFLDYADRHPFLYIPFSGGARNCIGQKFAQLEDKILLTHIMRHFKVESELSMEQLQMSLELVLRPTQGLHLKVTPRVAGVEKTTN